MTEGSGGGTITTTALYSNHPEIIPETMNIKFIQACDLIFAHPELCEYIHAMTDVTNGGLRNDLYEINSEAHCGVKIDLNQVQTLVNSSVYNLLKEQNVDYLGVSLDSLLIYCHESVADAIIELLQNGGIKIQKIGEVIVEQQVVFISDNIEALIIPKFRESAYTPIKKVIDQCDQESNEDRENKIRKAFDAALLKKAAILRAIQN